MDTIKFPIKFTSNGLSKLTEGTSDYFKQLLSFAALTEPGQFRLTPKYGVFDPSYRLIDSGVFMVHASRFVPEVTIGAVNLSLNSQTSSMSLNIEFRIN